MKRLFAIGALACALALGACATGSPSQDVEKSLIAAHATYDGITIALQTATTTGVLHGSAATQAQSVYDEVGKDLAQADADWKAGESAALIGDDLKIVGDDEAKLCTSNIGCKPTISDGSQ